MRSLRNEAYIYITQCNLTKDRVVESYKIVKNDILDRRLQSDKFGVKISKPQGDSKRCLASRSSSQNKKNHLTLTLQI